MSVDCINGFFAHSCILILMSLVKSGFFRKVNQVEVVFLVVVF